MDEPLSNLDAKLRNQMRAEIIKLRQKINTTFIYVTHDQAEAMTLGDRIVIMRDGFIQQIGTPQEVFNQPGQPVRGRLHRHAADELLRRDAFQDAAANTLPRCRAAISSCPPTSRRLFAKMEQRSERDHRRRAPGAYPPRRTTASTPTVDVSELMGSELHLHVNSNGKDVVIVVSTTDIDLNAVHGSHKKVK